MSNPTDPWPEGHPLHGTPTHPPEQAAPVHDEPDPALAPGIYEPIGAIGDTGGPVPPVSDEPADPESHNAELPALPDDEEPSGWAPLDIMTPEEKIDEILSIMRGLSDQVEAIKTQAEDNPMGLIQGIMSGGLGSIL